MSADRERPGSVPEGGVSLPEPGFPPLGLSGRIARMFINTPVTPMLLIGALCVGLLGLLFTPRQEDPQISVPMIDIYVQYQGASARQVETLVTQPLERIMKEIPGVRHVYSATLRGAAIVTVRFEVGEDMGASVVKVHDKLQSNMDRMPPNVQPPLVKPMGVDDVPVVTLTLWSESVADSQLRSLALDVLQDLGALPNTGKGFVVGGRAEQIRVEVQMDRLAGFNVTLDRIAATIQGANSELATGASESGGTAYNVYSGAFLRSAEDVARLVVGTQGGRPIYVGDLAQVEHVPQDAEQVVTHSTGAGYSGDHPVQGAAAVTLAIAKKEGSNGVTVANTILARLAQLEGTLIPSNVQVEVTRNYGKTANDKVNELLKAMFEAALIVAVLCLIGLGTRAAFVVLTVIPIVILVTIWWAWVVDYTIDRVSLFALIFAIGILVDDATVVVENIFRHWLEGGETSVDSAVRAVDEVGNPTILATLTIISALLPMGWVSGLMGPYMRPIPVLGSSAMFFSLVAAFVFTPWFALRVRPRLAALHAAERREEKTRYLVSKVYRPLVVPLIEHRALGIGFLVAIIAATAGVCVLFYTQTVAVKMLPFDNKPEFSVVVNMPEGTALPETANALRLLAEKVKDLPEVTMVQTYAGTAQPFNFNGMVRHYYIRNRPWEGDLLVMLTDKRERELGSHALAVQARALLAPIAKQLGARIAVVEMPPGPPVLQTVVAEVYGPTDAVRRQVAADLTGLFEQAEGVVDVDNYMAGPYDYWRFEVDTEKAVRRGISVDSVNQNLAMAMGGFKAGDVKRGSLQEPTWIVMQVPLAYRAQLDALGSLPVMSPSGEVVPLVELGRFVKVPEDPIIYHKDLRPMEYVVGEMEGRLGAPIYGMLNVEDLLDDYTTPDGVKISGMPMGLIGPPDDVTKSAFEWSGEWTVTYETFRDMGLAFMAALVLIYGLIVWEFRNFALAGLIMSPIPLTLIGIVPGHLIMGAEFTATSMIGLIALGGIIVRQSILIVEFVKIEAAKGKSVTEAAVLGAEVRMRPILITSLTTAGGAWTLINDPIFQGMAVSIFFGAGVGTLMAVIVIPLGCISARRQFYMVETVDGDIALSERYAVFEDEDPCAGLQPLRAQAALKSKREAAPLGADGCKRRPLALRLWGWLVSAILAVVRLIGAVLRLLARPFGLLRGRPRPGPKPGGGPASGSPGPGVTGGGALPSAPSAPSTPVAPVPAQGVATAPPFVPAPDQGQTPARTPAQVSDDAASRSTEKKPRAPRRPKIATPAKAESDAQLAVQPEAKARPVTRRSPAKGGNGAEARKGSSKKSASPIQVPGVVVDSVADAATGPRKPSARRRPSRSPKPR